MQLKANNNSKNWRKKYPKKHKQQRLNKYGITVEYFEMLLMKQNNSCAICGRTDDGNKSIFPHVDHCHKTEKVRGLLCLNCNHGLGKFKDDLSILLRACKYLKRN